MAPARKGLFFALVGPGGAGKTTLLKAALPQIDNLRQLATATTRSPRPGETHGCERYFLSESQFIVQIKANAFYEYEEVHPGTYYGTPRADIDAALGAGCDLIADIDAKGACFLRVALPESLRLIFVAPPNIHTLRQRLERRGDEEQATQARIDRFAWEMSFTDVCDDTIVNETLSGAVDALKGIVETARCGQRNVTAMPSYASVLPMKGEVLYWPEADEGKLRTRLQAGELPHDAALRWIEERMQFSSDRGTLSPDQLAACNFVPILHVTPSRHDVVFHYVWDMAPEVALPLGWHPYPLAQAPLPNELRLLLWARFKQRSRSYG